MLRERLQAVYDFVDKCDCLIDIGTDHAYIPIKCVEEGKTVSAVAADINVGPVKIADKNIEKYGLCDSIQTVVSNGFEKLGDIEADAVVIAGMGGTLISEILERGLATCGERFLHYKQIVLQPMNDIEDLRRWLKRNGFVINEERLVAEETKIYCMMKVVYVATSELEMVNHANVADGMNCANSENRADGHSAENSGSNSTDEESSEETLEFLLGRLSVYRDELMQRFVDKMINRRKRILSGFDRSKEVHGGELTEELDIEYQRVASELRVLEVWKNNNF